MQVRYAPGWRARAGGRPVPVSQDGLGLMVIKPGCQGRCDMTVSYEGGWEWRLTWAASLLVMAAVVFAGIGCGRRALTPKV